MVSILAAAEERWLVPTFSSRYADTWIAAHEWLTFPFRLRGPVRRYLWPGGDRPRTVVTIGGVRRLRRFCEQLAGPLDETPPGGRHAVWSPSQLASVDADLVVAEIHRWAMTRFRRDGWLIMPNVVRWQGELAFLPPPQPSKSLRDDLRKVRQHKYRLARAYAMADWDEFYTTMVVPQAAQRFGDAAWFPSAGFRHALEKVAVLLFVYRGTERVGGFCAVPAGDAVWIPLIGTRAGDESLRREGVLAAAYALGMDWARAQGYRFLDLGRTSGFLSDGIAIYKRKWGLEPVSDPLTHVFAVKIGHPGAAAAFAREPVWIETDDGLEIFDGDVS